MPPSGRNTPVQCLICDKIISRSADMPRHTRTHAENKEDLMHPCTHPGCNYRTLQKSNLQTHKKTHTGERSQTCPEPGCNFASTDPSTLTHHRKRIHGYKPKARCNSAGKYARRAAAAPYPSARLVTPDVEIHVPLDLNDLTFPGIAGLAPCDGFSPAESSNSGIPQFSGVLADFSWEQLFPHLSAGTFAVCGQPTQLPIPASNYFQPPTVPVDLSTVHTQFDPFSDEDYRQPVHDVKLQHQPISEANVNNSLPADLEEFLQRYGSGYFEGRCEYPNGATDSMTQPSFTNEFN